MKALLFLAMTILFAVPGCEAAAGALIYEHVGRDCVTNQWFLSSNQIKSSPRWDPLKDAPPLSVKDAVRIASDWLERQRATNRAVVIWGRPDRVNKIDIDFLTSNEPRFRGVSWYVITFETGTFDHRACVVLMDGLVLEPAVRRVHKGSFEESTSKPDKP